MWTEIVWIEIGFSGGSSWTRQ